jgi:hypothetical protein
LLDHAGDRLSEKGVIIREQRPADDPVGAVNTADSGQFPSLGAKRAGRGRRVVCIIVHAVSLIVPRQYRMAVTPWFQNDLHHSFNCKRYEREEMTP